ncbi:MAG: TetR/AcrR family transcriptional regulator [Oryzihumus sp.]
MTLSLSADNQAATLSPRQTQIRDQILETFLAEGFVHLTLDDLARRLGCSKATIYTLADSKEQLVVGVIQLFFARATEQIEAATRSCVDAPTRVGTYLGAIADELRPASAQFMADLYAFKPARRLYEVNTRIAGRRVRDLIEQGVTDGSFRAVNSAFVGEVVAATIVRIHHGDIATACHLSDADAFAELAQVVLHGVTRLGPNS